MTLIKKNLTLDKDSFDKFKGLLILIIIAVHTQLLISDDINRLLSTFYVSLFFILPFLFNKDQLNANNSLKIFKRYYIPFVIFLSIGTILYAIAYTHNFSITKDFLATAIIGTNPLIKNIAGSSYLWFFPVLISTLLLLMFYNSLKSKIIFIGVMVFLHISITLISKEYLNLFPLGSATALFIFSLALLISYLYHNHLQVIYTYGYYVFFLFFTLLYLYQGRSYWYATIDLPNITMLGDLILFDLIQIFAFFSILFLSHTLKCNYLTWIGHRTIVIYTVHPLIIFALNYLHHWQGLIEGITLFILAILISSTVAFTMPFIKLEKYIYPR